MKLQPTRPCLTGRLTERKIDEANKNQFQGVSVCNKVDTFVIAL